MRPAYQTDPTYREKANGAGRTLRGGAADQNCAIAQLRSQRLIFFAVLPKAAHSQSRARLGLQIFHPAGV